MGDKVFEEFAAVAPLKIGMAEDQRIVEAEAGGRLPLGKGVDHSLEAPDLDEVVLSGIIHNDLDEAKTVRAILELEGETVEPLDETTRDVHVEAGGETRVDWRVKALGEGDVTVRMKALTDEESDAMQMTFPVYVHGIEKTMSFSAAIRPDETETTITIDDRWRVIAYVKSLGIKQ